jgi:hypothetical protein
MNTRATNDIGNATAVDDNSWLRADAAARQALREARSRTIWQALTDAAALDANREALIAAPVQRKISPFARNDN